MKTQYKYIHFEQMTNYEWVCENTEEDLDLGEVRYNRHLEKWEFDPDMRRLFSASCLDDISHFMKQLKEVKA